MTRTAWPRRMRTYANALTRTYPNEAGFAETAAVLRRAAALLPETRSAAFDAIEATSSVAFRDSTGAVRRAYDIVSDVQ